MLIIIPADLGSVIHLYPVDDIPGVTPGHCPSGKGDHGLWQNTGATLTGAVLSWVRC